MCLFIHFSSIVEHLDGPNSGINAEVTKADRTPDLLKLIVQQETQSSRNHFPPSGRAKVSSGWVCFARAILL